jgi:hypothetical protein
MSIPQIDERRWSRTHVKMRAMRDVLQTMRS